MALFCPKKKLAKLFLLLQLFIRIANKPKEAILNYGLETGECSECGRKLTSSESIRLGIGPVCHMN